MATHWATCMSLIIHWFRLASLSLPHRPQPEEAKPSDISELALIGSEKNKIREGQQLLGGSGALSQSSCGQLGGMYLFYSPFV